MTDKPRMMPVYNQDPGDENDASPERWISETTRRPAPMSKADLWEAVSLLSRLMGESVRRELGSETFDAFDRARILAVALYSVTPEEGHSVRVVPVVVK